MTCWMSVTRLLPRRARGGRKAPLHARNSPDDTRSPAVPPGLAVPPVAARPELLPLLFTLWQLGSFRFSIRLSPGETNTMLRRKYSAESQDSSQRLFFNSTHSVRT